MGCRKISATSSSTITRSLLLIEKIEKAHRGKMAIVVMVLASFFLQRLADVVRLCSTRPTVKVEAGVVTVCDTHELDLG